MVIFDCDGVLADTESIAAGVISAYFADHGVVLSAAECEARFAGADLQETREAFIALGGTAPDDFVITIRASILEVLSHGVDPIDGVHDLLSQISLPFCVASGGRPEKIHQSLRLANLLDHFGSNTFSAFDVGHHKPDPRLFLHAAETMGVAPPNTLVVEDSRVGVQAGVAAGMTVVGYAGGRPAQTLLDHGAHQIIDDMRRVADFL